MVGHRPSTTFVLNTRSNLGRILITPRLYCLRTSILAMFLSILKQLLLPTIIYSFSLQVAAQTNQPGLNTSSWFTNVTSSQQSKGGFSVNLSSAGSSISGPTPTSSNISTSVFSSAPSPLQVSAIMTSAASG